MPQVPAPEDLPDLESLLKDVLPRLPPDMRRILQQKRPFEFRPVEPPSFLRPQIVLLSARPIAAGVLLAAQKPLVSRRRRAPG